MKTIFSDFLDDYFTVDSKILKSLIPLLIKPGFLTIEYLKGRRLSYVKPFRIYIITSMLFFFFVFFSSGTSQVKNGDDPVLQEANVEGVATLNNNSADSTQINYNISLNQDTTRSDSGGFGLANYFRKKVENLEIMDRAEIIKSFSDFMENNLPRVMFFLLPVIALILMLFFKKQRKYYIEHFVFSLHLHSFGFILAIISVLIGISVDVNPLISSQPGNVLNISLFRSPPDLILFFLMILYTIIAMSRVYGQGYGIISVKFAGIVVLYTIVLVIAMALTMAAAILSL